jgi:zinc protease
MKRFIAILSVLMVAALPVRADVDIKEITTPVGFKAWLVEDHSIPFMALRLGFMGGASLDAPGKRGATNLMMALLEEGTGDLDARGFASAREALAATIKFDVSDDTASVSVRMLTENRDAVLELARGALVAPNFDQSAVDRVRGQVLSGIQSSLKNPNNIAQNTFDAAAFGDHPYGSTLDGTLDSVEALTRDDIVTAHRNVIAKDRVYISAVGDITEADLAVMIDALLADLPETGAPLPERVDIALEAGVHVTPYETPQSVALFGHRGIERTDPDFFPAFVAATIFGGGGFESRLMKEVREKRGLTYGIYAFLALKDHADLVMGQVASANDRMGQAIEVIQDEWVKLAEDGVTQAELDQAKTYLTGAYPLRFDGNGTIANILVGMQMNDLPIEYVNTRNANIDAVTLDEINAVIKRVFVPEDLHFTVVGQPEGL